MGRRPPERLRPLATVKEAAAVPEGRHPDSRI
jgi:hypothetical protein